LIREEWEALQEKEREEEQRREAAKREKEVTISPSNNILTSFSYFSLAMCSCQYCHVLIPV